MSPRITLDKDRIAEFCRKWNVVEFALFGSVLRDDFRPDSDVDVLVSFSSDSHTTLFDLVHMQDELEGIIGRGVDLVSKRAIEQSRNPIRRGDVLGSAEVVYAV